MRNLGPLPSNAILVTVDVVALYPSIPHKDGLDALKSFLVRHNFHDRIIQAIADMAELVLTRNLFEFNEEYFLQVAGTAIGTKMAPAYANIFMSILETEILTESPLSPTFG